ncbi:MAG: CapA family protein [Lachnospiraceae bacterium]|nr:CapA family protein [Lachnospiraceae bacterium]
MMSETSLIFTGDIGFDKYMDRKWEDDELVSEEILEYLHSGNHLIINVEGPLSRQDKVERANGVAALTHSMNPDAVRFFDKIGADVWNICNNHIMDAGQNGMADTLKEASKAGVMTLGAGMNISEASKPVIFNECGGIGMIGVGYQRACRKADEETPGCFSWSDMELIQKRIDEIKKTCRWCIVVAHGGEEFTALPSPYVRKRYMDYLDMGADIVISHHPHVPMNYETFPGKAIFYSLGNFVFDTDYQRSQYNTEYGLFIKLKFTETEFSFEPFGIEIDRTCDHVIKGDIPDIFVDVREEEYEKLAPFAAKMFIENTKRQLRYLKPDIFNNATEEDFYNNFYEPLRSGRVPGEVLDFQIVYPLSLEEKHKAWKESKLESVKNYMLRQIDDKGEY